MMIVRKIENEVDLQNAATSTILGKFSKKEEFSKEKIIEEIQNNENFNNFCDEIHLTEVVENTIEHFVRNSYFTYELESKKYIPK